MLGFLMSFRSWCAENDESRELAEAGLAHVVAGVERAYMRSNLLEVQVAVVGMLCRLPLDHPRFFL